MARIYLGDIGEDYVIGNSRTEVYGTGSRKDSIILNSDVRDINIQSTIELVTLKDSLSDYQFSQGFGSNIIIYDNEDNIIANMGSVDGKTITIDGYDFDLLYEDGVVSIGGNELSKEPIHIESSVSSEYEISDDGITVASDDRAEVFTIVSGSSYSHKINNFDIFNDKLDFGDGITAKDLTIVNTANDGKVFIKYSPDMGSTTVNIELTGLSLKEDTLLTTEDGINSILNGYVAPIEDGDDTPQDYVNDVAVGDAGDSLDNATSIELTDDLDFNIKGYYDDADNYSFIADSSGTLSLDLYGMSENLDLSLYSSDGETVSSFNSGTSSESITFNITAGEKYTIQVAEHHESLSPDDDTSSDAITTDYNLYGWLKADEGEESSAETDDYIYDFEEGAFVSLGDAGSLSEDGATPISLDAIYNDAYLYGYASDDDDYSFEATQNGTLYVSLDGMSDDLDLELISDSGESLSESRSFGTDGEYISYDVKEGETYTINIETVDGSESTYDLSIFIV